MKPGQELSNAIGNAVGECKRAMLDRLKAGADLADVMAQFFAELNVRFDAIIAAVNGTKEEQS